LAGRFLIAPWLDRISRRMNALALAKLELGESDAVLEIGFGGGALLAAVAGATSGRIIGIDISDAMVARAGRRFGARVELHRASPEALPLEPASIDKAVSVNSLYFWPDPAAAFAGIARVVRPGGRLVLCFEPADELRKWPGHRHGFRLFEVEEVRGLMAGAGFGAIEEAWGEGRKPDRFCCLSGRRLGANG
jgi:arsenite methyltransferase